MLSGPPGALHPGTERVFLKLAEAIRKQQHSPALASAPTNRWLRASRYFNEHVMNWLAPVTGSTIAARVPNGAAKKNDTAPEVVSKAAELPVSKLEQDAAGERKDPAGPAAGAVVGAVAT